MESSKLIYGKNDLDKIVSIEIEDNHAFIYRETETGIQQERVSHAYWTLLNGDYDLPVGQLSGKLHYKYYLKHETKDELKQSRYLLRKKNADFFAVYDDTSA